MINEYDLATEISKNNELDKAMVADIISSVLNTSISGGQITCCT
jgi:hypothetical protein